MLIIEKVTIRGNEFNYTHSNKKGYGVERDGVVYMEAYDPVGIEREYNEVKLENYRDEIDGIVEETMEE